VTASGFRKIVNVTVKIFSGLKLALTADIRRDWLFHSTHLFGCVNTLTKLLILLLPWSQSYKTFFIRKYILFPFFASQPSRFSVNACFLNVINIQA